jgi:hypothetical protein
MNLSFGNISSSEKTRSSQEKRYQHREHLIVSSISVSGKNAIDCLNEFSWIAKMEANLSCMLNLMEPQEIFRFYAK